MQAFWQQHRFLLVFVALAALMGTSVGMGRVATSLYAVELGAGAPLLGLISASQSIGALVMGLPVGLLVERWGPGRLFALGSVLAGTVYALIPAVPLAGFLIACTATISFVVPLRFVSMNTVFLAQLQSLGEARAGWYRGSHLLGLFLIGPLLGSAAVAALAFGGTYPLIGLLFLATLPLVPLVFGRGAVPEPAAPSNGARRLPWRELPALARHRGLRQTSLVDFCNHAATVFFGFFIVVIVVEQLQQGAMVAASLVALQGAALITALFGLGGLTARLGARRSCRIGFGLLALATLLLGVAGSLQVLALGAVLLGLGAGLLQIVTLTRYARASAVLGRGRTAGVSALAAPAGNLSGSLLGGLLGQLLGLQPAFWFFTALFLLLLWRGPALQED